MVRAALELSALATGQRLLVRDLAHAEVLLGFAVHVTAEKMNSLAYEN